MKKNLVIGYNSKNYAAKRLILDKIEGVIYKDMRFYNYYFWINIIWWILKILKISPLKGHKQYEKLFLKYKKLTFTKSKIDGLHLFNTVNYSEKLPWVLTVETFAPYDLKVLKKLENEKPDFSSLRNNKNFKKTIKLLAGNNCKGILPLSTCTYNIQLEIIKQFPEYLELIKNKMKVLHPPQELLIQNMDEKALSYDLNEKLRFIFIGRTFYLKGGLQMLKAFDKFKNTQNFEVTIVAKLDYKQNDFVFAAEKEIEETIKYIEQNKSWINHYESVSNSEVLQLIKNAHVGLLPTWVDTYGYALLECQAGGCPVISTNVRALSEINNNDLGWLIDVPTNRLNHPQFYSTNDFKEFAISIESGLAAILKNIFENKESIKQKGEACLEKIRREHNPIEYAKTLENIYNGNLKS